MLSPNRYLDYYFIVSEIEFVIEIKDNFTIMQKKGWIIPPRINTQLEADVKDLAIVLYSKILNEIYGLPAFTMFDAYLIQLSMHYKIKKSLEWYKNFYANPRYVLEYIKNNLQFMSIKPKWTPNNFSKLFEITRLDIHFNTDYKFSIIFWFQNIEDALECYTYKMEFDHHRKNERVLGYALAWKNRQLEKRKENRQLEKRKEKAIIANILDSWKSHIPLIST